MESNTWICLALLSLVGYNTAAILRVDATASSELVALRRNVTFTCMVEKSTEDTDSAIRIGKTLIDINGEYKTQLINKAGAAILENRFANTDRYHLEKISDGLIDKFVLKIENIQLEDNAPFGCQEVQLSEMSIANFQVIASSKNAEWGGYSSGETVNFEEGMGKAINCTVYGGSPAPDIIISVGDHDYSEFFRTTHSTEVICPEVISSEDNDCLMHREHTTVAHSPDFEPLPEHQGEELECRALIPNTNFEAVRAVITIDMLYAPAFDCSNHAELREGKKNGKIRCDFSGNPDVTDVWYRYKQRKQTIELRDGESNEEGDISVSRVGDQLVLNFAEVTKDHQDKEYTIVAKNSRGTNDFAIHLTEVGEANPNSASISGVSLFVVVSMALIGRWVM